MSKRLVIILWATVLVLGGLVFYVKYSQSAPPKAMSQRVAGQTLLEKFPAADVAAVTLTGVDHTVHLVKKDDKWIIADRENYPANPTLVNDLIRKVAELKIIGAVDGATRYGPRFGIDVKATKPEDHGLTVTFADASGKELASLSLGKPIGDDQSDPVTQLGGRSGSTGRFVINQADQSAVYKVGETFGSLTATPKDWFSADFIDIEKPVSVAVTLPGKSDLAWKLTRPDEKAEYTLEGATPADKFDPTTTASLKTLSIPHFDDVVSPADVEKRSLPEQKRVATIVTEEGFTYTLNLTPSKPAAPAAPPAPGESPAGDNYLMTVDVTATLPKERKKEADEKPEDAKTKDEAFATRLKQLQDKLTKEQALKGRTFEMRGYSVEALLKGRDAFKKQDTPAAKPQQGMQGMQGMQGLPPGILQQLQRQGGGGAPAPAPHPAAEAVTPPISVPTEDEGK